MRVVECQEQHGSRAGGNRGEYQDQKRTYVLLEYGWKDLKWMDRCQQMDRWIKGWVDTGIHTRIDGYRHEKMDGY